jgi:hypothetical protein
VGIAAGRPLPARAIKLSAAALFIGFGLWSLAVGIRGFI